MAIVFHDKFANAGGCAAEGKLVQTYNQKPITQIVQGRLSTLQSHLAINKQEHLYVLLFLKET
jgi:hypothetical protein